MRRVPVSVIVFLLFGGGVVSAGTAGRAHPAAEGGVFPAVAGWTLAPPPGDSVYTPDNLWDIIDGAAELFLSYGLVDLRIGEYTDAAGTDVRVELYRHSSKANAFGIYSQERNTGYDFIDIGTQGYIEDGTLNLLCGTYYVKMSSHREGKTGREAMEMIGRRVVEHLRQEKGWPAALRVFPPEKRIANADGYLSENFLGYKFFHSAFTARYEGGSTLFLMEYASAALAREAADAYVKAVGLSTGIPEGKITDVTDRHIGPVLIFIRGRRIAGAYGDGDAPGRGHLELLKARLPHHPP